MKINGSTIPRLACDRTRRTLKPSNTSRTRKSEFTTCLPHKAARSFGPSAGRRYMKSKLDAIAQVLLVQYPANMPLNGAEAKVQFRCDLFVAQSAGDSLRHAPFRIREFLVTGELLNFVLPFAEHPSQIRMSALDAIQDRRDDCYQFLRLEGFCDVRIHAGSEALDTIRDFVLGG